MINLLNAFQNLLDKTRTLDFLAPLALRLYLAPVFWVAGINKIDSFQSTVEWFGNPDWGLGLPFPAVMATLATGTELLGAVALTLGLGVRWISIPLMVTMVVATVTVHWQNGWQAIHDRLSPFPSPNVDAALARLDQAREILQQNGDFEWLTEYGSLVLSNNGVEWPVTYLVMLMALFFVGGGRFLSADYWLAQRFRERDRLTSSAAYSR